MDPVGAVSAHGIVLGSNEAMTITRVSGGVFVGIAGVLVLCLVSDARLRTGTAILAVVAIAITATRLVGLVVDGPTPFTLEVLKPEIALVVLSSLGFLGAR